MNFCKFQQQFNKQKSNIYGKSAGLFGASSQKHRGLWHFHFHVPKNDWWAKLSFRPCLRCVLASFRGHFFFSTLLRKLHAAFDLPCTSEFFQDIAYDIVPTQQLGTNASLVFCLRQKADVPSGNTCLNAASAKKGLLHTVVDIARYLAASYHTGSGVFRPKLQRNSRGSLITLGNNFFSYGTR